MNKDFEQRYHEVEDVFWWFCARREIILNLLAQVPKDAAVLDVGCSGGAVIRALKQRGFNNISGIDVSEAAINRCHQQHIDNTYMMDAAKLKWKDNVFDVLIASDVLEHIEDDKAALSEWNRVLKKGGILIVFVPAFRFLWSSHDTINNHFRRYTKKDLVQKLVDSNFKINRSSYWNMFLFFPVAIVRIIRQWLSNGNNDKLTEKTLNTSFNCIFLSLLRFENWLLTSINLPLGISVFAQVRKEGKN